MRKPCQHYGCPVAVPYGHAFCAAHKKDELKRIRMRMRSKQKTVEQAKFYHSSFWQRTRTFALAGHPVCEHCQRQAATEVDHIDGDFTNNRPENLQALCTACHTRKTNRQDGGGFNSRKAAPRKAVEWGKKILW